MDVGTGAPISPGFRGPDRSFRTSAGISAWTSAGYPAPKLTLLGEAPFSEPLLRTLRSEPFFYCNSHSKPPLLRSLLSTLPQNLLRTLLRSVCCRTALAAQCWKATEEYLNQRGTNLVAHDCGYPLSRYTCRATRVAADCLDFIAFCRCSTGVALHPLGILVSHLPPPPVLGSADFIFMGARIFLILTLPLLLPSSPPPPGPPFLTPGKLRFRYHSDLGTL